MVTALKNYILKRFSNPVAGTWDNSKALKSKKKVVRHHCADFFSLCVFKLTTEGQLVRTVMAF